MKKDLKDFGKIFSFTFSNQVRAKGYVAMTLLLAVICLAVPAAGMAITEYVGMESEEEEFGEGGEDSVGIGSEGIQTSPVKNVYVVDNTEGESIDFSYLALVGDESFRKVDYTQCEDVNAAAELAEGTEDSLILLLETRMGSYSIQVLLPDASALEWEDAWAFEDFISQYFQVALIEKSGLDYSTIGVLNTPVYITEEILTDDQAPVDEEVADGAGEDGMLEEEDDLSDGMEALKMVLAYLLPYVNIMVLYFMVLLYGQSIAGNVILEKSSKLMDTFLVSVKPWTMIFGKVAAIVSASCLQLLLWIGSLIGGFALGNVLVQMINPDTDMILVLIFNNLEMFTMVFSIPGTIIGILIMLAGFMLYSTLASICGAVVDKQEDLSSSIGVFTMVLIVSFFCTLSGGLMSETGAAAWMNWVPFTATLITPAGLMIGNVSVAEGLGSLAVILVSIVLLMLVAGKIYKMMALYKGKAPSIKKLVQMMKNQ